MHTVRSDGAFEPDELLVKAAQGGLDVIAVTDHDEEWLLDLEQQVVKRASPPPRGAEVRGRVSDYALVVNGSSWLEISNISFHATTLSVAGDISNVTLSSLEFNYSAVSRRVEHVVIHPFYFFTWSREWEIR